MMGFLASGLCLVSCVAAPALLPGVYQTPAQVDPFVPFLLESVPLVPLQVHQKVLKYDQGLNHQRSLPDDLAKASTRVLGRYVSVTPSHDPLLY